MKNATMSVAVMGDRIEFSFPEIGEIHKIQLEDLSQEILVQATLHGIKQKCVDAAALSRDPTTGRSATVVEKRDAVAEMIERLMSGTWNDRGAEGSSALLNALIAAYPDRSRDSLSTWLKTKSDKEKRALRNSAKLKPFLREEPSAAGDALLEEIAG